MAKEISAVVEKRGVPKIDIREFDVPEIGMMMDYSG